MPEGKLTLITGRSTRQGAGISNGKELEEYQTATTVILFSPTDMDRLGLHDENAVRLKTRFGTATVTCKSGNLPAGIAFLAFGPAANQLVGGDTQLSGMPDTKGFEIEVEPITA